MSETQPQPETPAVDLRREYQRAMRKCTPKQRIWLRKVSELAGASWAAGRRVGISSHTVWKWLRLDSVRNVLNLQAQMAELDNDLTPARIQREYERLAFSDLRTLYDAEGNLLPPHKWDDAAAAAVQEYSFDAQGRPKVKLHPKSPPLDTVARIRRVLVDRRELSGPGGGPIEVKRSADEFTDEELAAIASRGRTASAEPETGED